MNRLHTPWSFWFKVWIEFVVGIVTATAVFSLFSLMQIGSWIGLLGGLIWAGFRIKTAGIRFSFPRIRTNKAFVSLTLLCFISLCAGPHSFLDSYSYRIPQMLLWLQKGRPWSIPNVDVRINQMPHIWSFLSAPFYLLLGERGLALPNFISYMLLFGVFKLFSESFRIDSAKKKWILIIFMASPVMVMQASSNDNVLTCIAFLALSAYFALLCPATTRNAVYSGLAFSLCCGIKPQYVTLAPLWLLWFFIGENAPVRTFKYRILIWLFPLVVLCSPLPTFTVNYLEHGSIMHPRVGLVETPEQNSESAGVDLESQAFAAGGSFVNLLSQMFALPVTPFAGKLTGWAHEFAEKDPFLQSMNLSQLRIRPLLIAEDASFGFFTSIAFFCGLVFSRCRNLRYVWMAVGSFICMSVTIFLTVPSTLGRSFIGFFVLMLPLAICGLSRFQIRKIRAWGILCLLVGFFTIVMDPARPLWPVSAVTERTSISKLRQKFLLYAHYSQRHHSGRELVKAIPSDELHLGVIAEAGTPLVELWDSSGTRRNVTFFPTDVTSQGLLENNINYLIIIHHKLFKNDTVDPDFLLRIHGKVLKQIDYVSYMQRGPEPWALIKLVP